MNKLGQDSSFCHHLSEYVHCCYFYYFFNFKDLIYLFLEGGGREKERERNINVWLPLTHPTTGDLAGNWHVWDSNWRPFGSQAGTQSTEPHQPGLIVCYFMPNNTTEGRRNGKVGV